MVLKFDCSNNSVERDLWAEAVGLVAEENASNAILWGLADDLGTVRDIINNSGTVQNHIKWDSFDHVDAHHIAQLLRREVHRVARADVAPANDCDFFAHKLFIIAWLQRPRVPRFRLIRSSCLAKVVTMFGRPTAPIYERQRQRGRLEISSGKLIQFRSKDQTCHGFVSQDLAFRWTASVRE